MQRTCRAAGHSAESTSSMTVSQPLEPYAGRLALQGAVRHALGLSMIAAGLGCGVVSNASAAAFPPVIELSSLLPDNGGDGSVGFVLTGIDPGDSSGFSVKTAGDV